MTMPAVSFRAAALSLAMCALTVVAADLVWQQINDDWAARAASISTDGPRVVAVDPHGRYGRGEAAGDVYAIVLGDSHLYRSVDATGGRLIMASSHSVLDELARMASVNRPDLESRTFVRFATGAFTPLAMLETFADRLRGGLHPEVMIIGIRPGLFDATVAGIAEDEDLTRWLVDALSAPGLRAPAILLETLQAGLAERAATSRIERMEESALSWLSGRSGLWRERIGLRAFVEVGHGRFWSMVMPRRGAASSRNAEAHALNVAALEGLLALAGSHGTRLLCYLPPWDAEAPIRPGALASLAKITGDRGCPLIDATRAIPPGDEWWGRSFWVRDRSHFKADGHRRLAAFLYDAGARHGLWLAAPQSQHP